MAKLKELVSTTEYLLLPVIADMDRYRLCCHRCMEWRTYRSAIHRGWMMVRSRGVTTGHICEVCYPMELGKRDKEGKRHVRD